MRSGTPSGFDVEIQRMVTRNATAVHRLQRVLTSVFAGGGLLGVVILFAGRFAVAAAAPAQQRGELMLSYVDGTAMAVWAVASTAMAARVALEGYVDIRTERKSVAILRSVVISCTVQIALFVGFAIACGIMAYQFWWQR